MNPPSSYSLTVRFPSGTEFWQSERLPDVGAAISQYGRKYLVQYGRKYLVVSCERMPDGAFALNVAEQETSDGIEPAFA